MLRSPIRASILDAIRYAGTAFRLRGIYELRGRGLSVAWSARNGNIVD